MKKYMPYGFDLKFQYKTYRNIGKSYWIEFNAKKKILYKIRKIIRNVLNKKEEKYRNFDSFSQWESYIYEEFDEKKLANRKDYICYLKRSKRNIEIFCDMIGAVITPIYVVMLTMGATIVLNADTIGIDTSDSNIIKAGILHGFICMSIILVVVLSFLMLQFIKYRRKIYFYKDLIMVLENENTNH